MINNPDLQKRGFTLIEISITLVIIGLLAGGILVGKDMIRAAEILQQIKQLQDYQLAFNTFRTKYDCMPGDCSNATDFFGTTDSYGNDVINGNGDELIDTYTKYEFDRDVNNLWEDSIEISGVFQQLGLAKLVAFQPESTITIRVGRDLPGLRLNNQASFFVGASYNFMLSANGALGTPLDNLLPYKKGNNAFWLLACNFQNIPMGYWNDNCGIFAAADLQSIDQKIDDGKALSGSLLGFGGDTFFSGADTDCLLNGEYKVLKTTRECQSVLVIN